MKTGYIAAIVLIMSAAPLDAKDAVPPLTHEIMDLLQTERKDLTHGVAMDMGDSYGHKIVVQYTAPSGSSVTAQILSSAEVASRVGRMMIDNRRKPPGTDVSIKMALRNGPHLFTDTFSVRYTWQAVLDHAASDSGAGKLANTGVVEQIFLPYWPTVCRNRPLPQLFAGGDGDPEDPKDVENPEGLDLSCHRR